MLSTSQRRIRLVAAILALATGVCSMPVTAQSPVANRGTDRRPLVIIDTDIGDDIDDVFAVGLGLASPEVKVIAVTAGWGDTALRARMLDRLLRETGQAKAVQVGEGAPKHRSSEAAFSQAPWARREAPQAHTAAIKVILDAAREFPGQVTVVALAPMTDLAGAFAEDPVAFRKLKRIVAMGGSVRSGYVRTGTMTTSPPGPEYNIQMDPDAAMAVLGSGVPLYLMPLDSTQLKLDEVKRGYLFTRSTPLTDGFAVLYPLWSSVVFQTTPTLYDAVAMAFAIDAETCPVTPLRIRFATDGTTHEESGAPNSFVCLQSNEQRFFYVFLRTLGTQRLGEAASDRAR